VAFRFKTFSIAIIRRIHNKWLKDRFIKETKTVVELNYTPEADTSVWQEYSKFKKLLL